MAASARPGTPRVDAANQCIWWGERRVDLVPKAFLVLCRLMQQPNQIVAKNDLLDAAWPDTHVTDSVLKVAINQLRDALGDDPQAPRFIETVHRRGYRWIGGPSASETAPQASNPARERSPLGEGPAGSQPEFDRDDPAPGPLFVGREAPLAQLAQALARAAVGRRQIVFVTGEPGIGKTTLLDELVRLLRSPDTPGNSPPCLVAHGQCVDGYGTSDAYMPLLQALTQLCRPPTSGEIVLSLRRLAPTWLVQLPQVLSAGEQDDLRRALAGSSGERMLHELVSFVEALATDRTLVLVLEDLHWSDHATVGALAALAARREPARLLVVASYRPADAIAQRHPITRLKHELSAKRQCTELALPGLDPDAVAAHLAGRFPNHRLPIELAAQLQAQTAGNPLFMLNALEDFVQRGWLSEHDGVWRCTVDLAVLADAIPDGTREMIGFRLQQLAAADRELLATASVIGPSFATQALADVLGREPSDVEIDCMRLARVGQFIDDGQPITWPDRSTGTQHGFRHALYQQVLYMHVTPTRLQRLHRRVAECLETRFGNQAATIASQLALHFERGGDGRRAIYHRLNAATMALDRYAYDQAIEHLRSGLDIVTDVPAGEERDAYELAIQARLLGSVLATRGAASPQVSHVIERVRALSTRGPTTPELLQALAVLGTHYAACGDMRAARGVCEELVERAETTDHFFATIARGLLGFCELKQGEIQSGVAKLEGSISLPDLASMVPLDPGTIATVDAALGHHVLGHPQRARQLTEAALDRAETTKHPPTLRHVIVSVLRIGMLLDNDALVRQCAARLASLSEHFPHWEHALTEFAYGLLDAKAGNEAGIDRMQRARQHIFDAGSHSFQSLYAAMAAIASLHVGRYEEADSLLTAGLTIVETTGERWHEAELHRLRGEVRLARAAQQRRSTTKWQELVDDAAACFHRALDVARAHAAQWWRLRAAISLARLYRDLDRAADARELLRGAYEAFEERDGLPDLRTAEHLLERL